MEECSNIPQASCYHNQVLPDYQPGYQSHNHFVVRQPFRLPTLLLSKRL